MKAAVLVDRARQTIQPMLARFWAIVKASPRSVKIGSAMLGLYLLLFLLFGIVFKPSEYGWPGKISRIAFWPANTAKGFLFPDTFSGTDLSVISIPAIQVKLEEVAPRLTSVGTIEQFDKVEINAKSPGRIEQFYVREGDIVEKGQKIVQLERAFLEYDLRQQQAAHDAAKSEAELAREKYENARKNADSRFKEIDKQATLVKKLKADMDRSRTTYEGKKVLFQEGGISKEEFGETRNDVISKEAAFRMAQKDLEIVSVGFRDEDIIQKGKQVPTDPDVKRRVLIDINTAVDRAEVEVAKSRVRSAEAAMETTTALLKETTIISPITGLVASRNKSVGEQVTGGSVSTPSQAIMVLVDIRSVYGVMTIKESDLQIVKKGMRMLFTADPYPDEKFAGTVQIINPVVDSKTHTIEVKAVLDNPGLKLRPGMFIRSSIVSGQVEKMIVVPQTAVLPLEENRGYVFVIRADTVFKAQVQTGRQIDDLVEIKSGLNAGDIVATDKLNQLRESMKVTPVLPQAK